MLQIEFKRFIKNRMWFGYWFSYSWSFDESDDIHIGIWQRDPRHHWTPMILVFNTFVENTNISPWGRRYDTV